MEKEIKYWARKCMVTGQGMNSGYVWGEGDFYCIDDDKIAFAEFRADRDYILSNIPVNIEDIKNFDDYCKYDNDDCLQAIERAKQNKETDKDLRTLSYLFGLHYYTEWLDEEDIQYIEVNGVVTEYEN